MDNDTFTTGDLIEALTNERDTALAEVERLKVANGEAETEFLRALAQAKALREALELVLPLARGYAWQNRVGSNQHYVEIAEAALAAHAPHAGRLEIRTKGGEEMKDWIKEFNNLPLEIRTIGCAIECLVRIQHLNFEKDRLRRRYRESIAEINAHISNCETHLKKLERADEVKRLKAELQQIKTVTWCAYCGAEFPLDTVTSEQIEEHIGVCPKHPMRIPEAEAKALREVIKDYLEWGAMTGSDRDLFEDKFKAALAAHGGEDHRRDA